MPTYLGPLEGWTPAMTIEGRLSSVWQAQMYAVRNHRWSDILTIWRTWIVATPGSAFDGCRCSYDASRFAWRGDLWSTYTLRLHGRIFYHVHHTMIQQEHARTRKLDTREKFPLYGINNTLNFVCMTHYLLYWSSYLLLHLSHFQWTGISFWYRPTQVTWYHDLHLVHSTILWSNSSSNLQWQYTR